MVTICCVLKSGGDFTPEYVHRLRDGVAANTTVDHRFVCLTDVDDLDCETIPLEHDLPGWWSKLELFRLSGPCVYFDLDTVIRGNIDEILRHPHTFTALSDLNGSGRLASGVLAWCGDYSRLLTGFSLGMADRYRRQEKYGDQGYLIDYLGFDPERFQSLWPGAFVSYKWAEPAEREKAAVVLYHGLPRPHQTGWKA